MNKIKATLIILFLFQISCREQDLKYALKHQNEIESLDLSYQNITTLPKEIGELKNLRELNLSDNNIENLPTEFWLLENIEILNLNNNRISRLSDSIRLLKKLKRLCLNYNSLDSLPSLNELTNLQTLEIGWNRISNVSQNINNISSLKQLHLWNNPIPVNEKKVMNTHQNRLEIFYDHYLEVDAATYFLTKGNNYMQKNLKDDALIAYSESINKDPNLYQSFLNRGILFHQKNDYPSALADYNKVLSMKPDLTTALINRGIIKLFVNQDRNGACNDWSKAYQCGDSTIINYLNQYCK